MSSLPFSKSKPFTFPKPLLPKQSLSQSKKHELVNPDNKAYRMMGELIHSYHPHLEYAAIILIWKSGWKPDKDGRLIWGECKKASDFDKALVNFDFAILLNGDIWPRMPDKQKEALLDHELCHAMGEYDEEKDEWEWRIRKHDIEEFNCIVERYGAWNKNAEEFLKSITKKKAKVAS
jgi:putative metallopeptidase